MASINLRILLCLSLALGLRIGRRIYPADLMPESASHQLTGGGGESKSTDLDFKETMVGEAVTSDGFRYPIHDWKSNDGVALSSSILTFSSEAQAREALSNRIKGASAVVERGPRINISGRRTGERVMVTFSYAGRKEASFGILWTDGEKFHDIESFSLRHVLAFEQKFYPISKTTKPIQSREAEKP
jgi:hypothetical protein